MLMDAIKKSEHKGKVKISIDVAASESYKDGKYDFDVKNPDGPQVMKETTPR